MHLKLVLRSRPRLGQYLETVGTTDLALLSDSEWREFLRLMFTGFEEVLRRKILGDEPPF
jgi:uncharacterized protein DUF6511